MNVWLSICPRVENLFIYVFGYKISSYSKIYRWRRLQSGRLGKYGTGPLGSWGSWEISRKIARSEDSNPKYSPMWKRLQKTFWKKRKWDFWPQIISDFKVFNLEANSSGSFDNISFQIFVLNLDLEFQLSQPSRQCLVAVRTLSDRWATALRRATAAAAVWI